MSGAIVSEAIVVVNAGSTSLKFGAYAVDASRSLPLLCRGQIDSMESDPHCVVKNAAGKQLGVLNQPRILQATESIRVLTGHY